MEQNHFRELARSLSCLQGGRFAGAVIMRADWQVTDGERGPSPGLQVLKDRHGLFMVRCVVDNEVLSVTMLLGRQAENSFDLSTWRVAATDILAFTADVGDTNWIHQGERPVIPGLLLMEKLLAKCPAATRQLSLRFYHAMFAGAVSIDWRTGKFFQRERMTAAFHWQ